MLDGVCRPFNLQTEDRPVSVFLNCLFNVFTVVSTIRNLRSRHAILYVVKHARTEWQLHVVSVLLHLYNEHLVM
jgi:hypothetical protein